MRPDQVTLLDTHRPRHGSCPCTQRSSIPNLRRIMLPHARAVRCHYGHADIIHELIDGATGI